MIINLIGNNLASWMIAATLAPYPQFTIQIMGDKTTAAYPPIQSVLPLFKQFLKRAKIDEAEFSRQVMCQPLLANQILTQAPNQVVNPLTDFAHARWFGFCQTGAPLGPASFAHLYSQVAGQNTQINEFSDYALGTQLAKQGQYIAPNLNPQSILSTYEQGYIIEVDSFINFLSTKLTNTKRIQPSNLTNTEAACDLRIDCRTPKRDAASQAIQTICWQCQPPDTKRLKFSKQIQLTEHGWLLAVKSQTEAKQINYQLNLSNPVELPQADIKKLVQLYSQCPANNAILDKSINLIAAVKDTPAAFSQNHIVLGHDWLTANSWAISSIDVLSIFTTSLLDCISLSNTPELFEQAFIEQYQTKLDSLIRYQQLLTDALNGTSNDTIALFLASGRIKQLDPDLIHPDWSAGLLMNLGCYPKADSPFVSQLSTAQILKHLEQISLVLQRTSQYK
ncbi:tryptophan 7-halogenase [Catenovulum sp. 2E275]|uniref:tryptophan 7-halogenase n=1 Tax=Catenovulum sp. 2E275 TaxID=2980497 RepID=UPI0021CEFDD9|nr:tryptophan 7-halogenase [Catenovulum sp. 2E275]MCU4674048.1 tryptophan 7-halogenase [Catenovulum sp. 2E275]